MAKIELFVSKVFAFEGGFVDDPKDLGGVTNMGVTLSTWKKMGYDKDGDQDIDPDDIRLLSKEDVMAVLKNGYWDRWQGDRIRNQSIAEILVDWLWCSGKWGIIIPQRLLKVPADGIVGPMTLDAVNSANHRGLHSAIVNARESFIRELVETHPDQGRFLSGWMNRLNHFKFVA